jgi:hypothetical protein
MIPIGYSPGITPKNKINKIKLEKGFYDGFNPQL